MPQSRKPNPKSQRQISNEQIEPYVNPENGETIGNPNIPSNFDQFTANEQNGIDFNRSEKLTFRGDTTKPFTIGFEDIDEAIHYYFSNVIRPSVVQNNMRIPVPVIYGSPERKRKRGKMEIYTKRRILQR
jgi:hypothetical protein